MSLYPSNSRMSPWPQLAYVLPVVTFFATSLSTGSGIGLGSAKADLLYNATMTGREMFEFATSSSQASIPAGVPAMTMGDAVVFPDAGAGMSRRALWSVEVSPVAGSELKSGDTVRAFVTIKYHRDPGDPGDSQHLGVVLSDGERQIGMRIDEPSGADPSVTFLDECIFSDGGYTDLEITARPNFDRDGDEITVAIEVRPAGSSIEAKAPNGDRKFLDGNWSLDLSQPLRVAILRDFGDHTVVIDSTDIRVTSEDGPPIDKFTNAHIRTPANDPVFGCGSLRSMPPVASCRDAFVAADPMTCRGCGSIDAGSFDPDGTAIDTPTQTPSCDYPLGLTNASLLVQEAFPGTLWSTCEGKVFVFDTTRPTLTPGDDARLIVCGDEPGLVEFPAPTVDDTCDDDPDLWGEIIEIGGDELSPTIPLSEDFTALVRPGSYVVRWWAEDAGGNIEVLDQHFEVFADHSLERCCGEGGEVIVGTWWADLISLPHDVDYHVDALGGGDLVSLGSGDDCIRGGAGGDSLHVGTGDNIVHGGSGGDAVFCGWQDGTLTAWGNSGGDALYGGWCSSTSLQGGRGDDVIYGSYTGPDFIVPGPGADWVEAGGGDDRVEIYHACEVALFEILEGGDGHDTLVIPVPLPELEANGLIVSGFEDIIVDDQKTHLSLCAAFADSGIKLKIE